MKALIKVYNGLHFCISTIDKLALLVMLVAISSDVIARQTGSGIVWAQEVATIAFVWFTFLSMTEGVKHKLHISITVLFDRLPKFLQKIINYFTEIAVGAVGLLMFYYGLRLFNTATRTLPATGWSAKWLYIMIPVSGFVICLDSIIFVIRRTMGHEVKEELDDDAKIIKEAKAKEGM